MDAKQFDALSKKLDAIIALLAIDRLGDKSKTETILLLNQFGLDNSTIATIINSTPGSVAVQLSKTKKVKEPKAARADHQKSEQEDELGLPSEGMPS